jgi:hypothetical protein
MIWSVPKMWKGETCFILAGGPSLKGFNSGVLRGRGRVITVNDSWRLAPWADANYFCDDQWWTNQIAANRRSLEPTPHCFHEMIYRGFWVAGSMAFKDHPQVRCLRLTGQQGLETDPTGLRHGSNSGYQAMGLAYHFGVSRIVLLGYDMNTQGARTHWHDEARPDGFTSIVRNTMLPNFQTLVEPLAAAGVEVINATPDSELKCWPFQPLEALLGGARAHLELAGVGNPCQELSERT